MRASLYGKVHAPTIHSSYPAGLPPSEAELEVREAQPKERGFSITMGPATWKGAQASHAGHGTVVLVLTGLEATSA